MTPTSFCFQGVGEKGRKCGTCLEDLVMCPGHFGYVTLDLPVYHVGYFKHVINILQSICKDCGRLLLDEAQRSKFLKLFRSRKDTQEREVLRKTVQDACKKVKYCPHCECYNGSIKKVIGQALKVVHDRYNPKTVPEDVMNDFIDEFEYSCQVKNNQSFGASDLEQNLKRVVIDMDALKTHNLFMKIVDEDIVFFNIDSNMCKPSDMIVTCIPAPPSCIRPTVAVSHGLKNEDDLTVKLAEIV